jgi:hypothetical protein
LYLLLRYTGLPEYYGVDEEASEVTLGFWYYYLFQESLWSVEYEGQAEDQDGIHSLIDVKEKEQWLSMRCMFGLWRCSEGKWSGLISVLSTTGQEVSEPVAFPIDLC